MFSSPNIFFHETEFSQDTEDSNPLIRSLALRTMTYIHVREFVEGAIPPLKALLKDNDPYVRKTAAFCVAKLYDHDKNLVESSDLIDRLNGMLRDDNPTVVSSALAALMDIWERSETIKLTIDYVSASKIVQILPDCSEWGQTYILEALMALYTEGKLLKQPCLQIVLCRVYLTQTQPSCSLARVSFSTS